MAVPDQGTNFVADVLNLGGEGNSNSTGLNNVKAGMVAVKNQNVNSLDDVISSLRGLQTNANTAYQTEVQKSGTNSFSSIRLRNRRDALGKWVTAFNIYFRYITAGRQNSGIFLRGFANWIESNSGLKNQRIGLNYPYGPQPMESTQIWQELLGLMPLNAPNTGGNNTFIGGGTGGLDPNILSGGGVNIIVNAGGFQTSSGFSNADVVFDPLPTGSMATGSRTADIIPDQRSAVLFECQNPKYWIKTTRGEDRSRQILEGPDGWGKFDIGYPCTLKFEIYRCCGPLTGGSSINTSLYNSVYNPGNAQKVAEYTVTAKNAWLHEPCNVSDRPQDTNKGKGKLYYMWYWDVEEIIKQTYINLDYTPDAERANRVTKTLLNQIYDQLATVQSPFVVGKTITEANMCFAQNLGLRGTYVNGLYNSATLIDTYAKYYGLKQGFPRPGRSLIPFDYEGRTTSYNPIRDAVENASLPAAGIVETLLIGLGIQDAMNLHYWSPESGAWSSPRWIDKYRDTSIIICKGATETQRDCNTIPPIILDDCKKPWRSNGDMLGWWNFREQPVNDYRDIEDNVNKETYKNGLYESLTLAPGRIDGAVQTVSGKTFVFKGSTIVSKEVVRTEKKKIDRAIAGSDCWSAEYDVTKYKIKRLRKHYIEVYCANGLKIDYMSSYDANGRPVMEAIPSDAAQRRLLSNVSFSREQTGKYVSTMVMQQSGNRNPQIETTGPNTGQWYVYTEFEYDIINGQTGVSEFVDNLPKIGSIKLTKGADCLPKEECKYLGFQLDTSNPCGCVDIEVYECFNVYSGFTYYDEMGNPIVIQDIREPKDFGNTYAKYMLPIGYKVTSERPSLSPECDESSIKIYHPLLFGQDIIRGSKKNITMGLFNTSQSLLCYHTSSAQNSVSKDYYYEITDCDNCNKKSYYAVAYGNRFGSGSLSVGYDYSDSPSRAIYGQNKLLCLEPPETTFKFYNSGSENTPSDIYLINFNRDGLSHRIDPGNFEINLAELSGSGIPNNIHTGSNVQISGSNPKILRLIDNSGDADESQFCVEAPYTSYDLVSGSIEDGVHETGVGTSLTTYGKFYPNLNLLILDASKLNSYLSFNTVTGSNIAGDNSFKLHTAISGAAVVGYPMKARNVREKTTNHYFIRIPSRHANYSTNPTFVTDDATRFGSLKYDCFVQNPVTYVTSIGLYNPKRELLAIAKLSKPIQKSLENDVLIKIRLNW